MSNDIKATDKEITAPVKDAYVEKITTWLPPCKLMLRDTKMRITFVDGAFQLYGHQKKARHIIRSMRAYFKARYDLEDHPEDLKGEWSVGEVCVAKFDDQWYRAQIVEMSTNRRDVAVIYVDLGNVRQVNISDLRIPNAFGNQPILANRMVLESIIPLNGDKVFPDHVLEAIQDEVGYWNTGYVKITSTRMVSTMPIPVKLHLVHRRGENEEQENFGQTLLECGLADNGEVDILKLEYNRHARVGI